MLCGNYLPQSARRKHSSKSSKNRPRDGVKWNRWPKSRIKRVRHRPLMSHLRHQVRECKGRKCDKTLANVKPGFSCSGRKCDAGVANVITAKAANVAQVSQMQIMLQSSFFAIAKLFSKMWGLHLRTISRICETCNWCQETPKIWCVFHPFRMFETHLSPRLSTPITHKSLETSYKLDRAIGTVNKIKIRELDAKTHEFTHELQKLLKHFRAYDSYQINSEWCQTLHASLRPTPTSGTRIRTWYQKVHPRSNFPNTSSSNFFQMTLKWPTDLRIHFRMRS